MAFDDALAKLMQDIKDNKNPKIDNLDDFSQLLGQKKVIWMEGLLGWTTWIDKFDDILHEQSPLVASYLCIPCYYVLVLCGQFTDTL